MGRFKKIPTSCDKDEKEETEDDFTGKFRDKNEVLNALVATVKDLKGKDRADVLMKIADLQQMKKEETIEEDNTVHFYLPISCKSCSLYMKAKNKKAQLETNNEEG